MIKSFKDKETDLTNIQSVSMINGGFALNGQAVMPLMLKLLIITKGN